MTLNPYTAIIHTLDQRVFVEFLWAEHSHAAVQKAGNLCGVNGTEAAGWSNAEPYTLVALIAGHHEMLAACDAEFAEGEPG